MDCLYLPLCLKVYIVRPPTTKVTICETSKHLGVVVWGSSHQRHQTKLIAIPIIQAAAN